MVCYEFANCLVVMTAAFRMWCLKDPVLIMAHIRLAEVALDLATQIVTDSQRSTKSLLVWLYVK